MVPELQQVEGRFALSEDARCRVWSGGGYVDGQRVKFSAVQGEPFGTATPSGSIDMVIANPAAIEVFRNAPMNAVFSVVFTQVS